MDPLSTFGAAATSIQLFIGAGKGVLSLAALVRKIEGLPESLRSRLRHVERELASLNDLLSADGPNHIHFSAQHYARISVPATESRKAVEELVGLLQPLTRGVERAEGKRKAVVRIWRSLLTVQKETELTSKLQAVERLNGSLLRELQLCALDLQASSRDRILSAIQSCAEEIRDSRESIDELKQRADLTQHEILTLMGNRTLVINQILQMIGSHFHDAHVPPNAVSQSTKARVNNVVLELQESRVQAKNQAAEIVASVQTGHQESKQRNEIKGISQSKDVLEAIGVLLNSKMALKYQHSAQPAQVRQPQETMLSIDTQSATATLTQLSFSHAAGGRVGAQGQPPIRCLCGTRKDRARWFFGRFRLRVQASASRICPLHGQASLCSIEVKLSPLLNGVLQVTCGILSGKTGWEVAPPLLFRAYVDRLGNPLFRAFDRFATIGMGGHYWIWNDHYQDMVFRCFHNDSPEGMAAVKIGLAKLIESLQDAATTGQICGREISSDGSTLLMEIMHLVTDLGPVMASACIEEILHLLDFASFLGANADTEVARPDSAVQSHKFVSTALSPTQYLFCSKLDATVCRDSQQDYMSFRQIISSLSTGLEPLQDVPLFNFCDLTLRSDGDAYWQRLTQLTKGCPVIADALDCSDLCRAGLKRSLQGLAKFYHQVHDAGSIGEAGILPIHCALGWKEGLQFYMERGCDVTDTLSLACRVGDEASVSALLSATNIFDGHYYNFFQASLKRRDIFTMLAKELWQRFELRKQDTSGDCRLQSKPPWPHCPIGLYGRAGLTPRLDLGGQKLRPYECHRILIEAGFNDLERRCVHRRTPLAEFCDLTVTPLDRTGRCLDDEPAEWYSTMELFLQHGGNAWFRGPAPPQSSIHWPHLSFYVAIIAERCGMQDVPKLVVDACAHDGLPTDTCDCFCSEGGCIPAHLIWHNMLTRISQEKTQGPSHKYTAHSQRSLKCLRDWVKRCVRSRRMKDRCYRAVCQLELFNRLGMRHTCCLRRLQATTLCFEEQTQAGELKELQSEDRPARGQLKQLLRFYDLARKQLFDWPVECFWSAWFALVDKILPPLTATETVAAALCRLEDEDEQIVGIRQHQRKHMLEKMGCTASEALASRQDRWRHILKAMGYANEDFKDIITAHFGEILTRARASSRQRARWRRFRLMASPKYLHRGSRRNLTEIVF